MIRHQFGDQSLTPQAHVAVIVASDSKQSDDDLSVSLLIGFAAITNANDSQLSIRTGSRNLSLEHWDSQQSLQEGLKRKLSDIMGW